MAKTTGLQHKHTHTHPHTHTHTHTHNHIHTQAPQSTTAPNKPRKAKWENGSTREIPASTSCKQRRKRGHSQTQKKHAHVHTEKGQRSATICCEANFSGTNHGTACHRAHVCEAQHNTQHNTQHNNTTQQHNTTQHNTHHTTHNTTQHNTTQHNTTHLHDWASRYRLIHSLIRTTTITTTSAIATDSLKRTHACNKGGGEGATTKAQTKQIHICDKRGIRWR